MLTTRDNFLIIDTAFSNPSWLSVSISATDVASRGNYSRGGRSGGYSRGGGRRDSRDDRGGRRRRNDRGGSRNSYGGRSRW